MKELYTDLIILVLFFILYQTIVQFQLDRKRYKITTLHLFGVLLFALSVLTSFLNAPISPIHGFHTDFNPTQLNLVPLKGISLLFSSQSAGSVLLQSISSLILLVPLGFFLPLLWKPYRNWLRVTLFGLLISLTIECSQLFLIEKADINDLLLNGIGVFIGYLLFALLQAYMPSLTGSTYIRRYRVGKTSLLVELEAVFTMLFVYFLVIFIGFLQ